MSPKTLSKSLPIWNKPQQRKVDDSLDVTFSTLRCKLRRGGASAVKKIYWATNSWKIIAETLTVSSERWERLHKYNVEYKYFVVLNFKTEEQNLKDLFLKDNQVEQKFCVYTF